MTDDELLNNLIHAQHMLTACVPHLPQYPVPGSTTRNGPKGLCEETIARIDFIIEGVAPKALFGAAVPCTESMP